MLFVLGEGEGVTPPQSSSSKVCSHEVVNAKGEVRQALFHMPMVGWIVFEQEGNVLPKFITVVQCVYLVGVRSSLPYSKQSVMLL